MPIIGVTNPDEGDADDRRRFAARMSTQVPHVLADSDDLWSDYGVSSQPSWVFVQADGTFERRVGGLGAVPLLERAQALAG